MANKNFKVPMQLLKSLWKRITWAISEQGSDDVKNIVRFDVSFSEKKILISDIASLISLAPKLLDDSFWRYIKMTPTISAVDQNEYWDSIYFHNFDRESYDKRKITENWKKFILQFKPYVTEMIESTTSPETARLGWWLHNEIVYSENQ